MAIRCHMKSFRNQRPHHGFTLIELLLYISISSVLLLALSLFLSMLLESRVKTQTLAEVDQQGVQVMQMIMQAVRNADTINAPTLGVGATSLSINTVTPALNPTTFDLSGGVIRVTEGLGSAVALTNARVVASDLTVTNLSRASTPGIVRVQFTLTYVNNTGRPEYDYTKTFYASASLRQP